MKKILTLLALIVSLGIATAQTNNRARTNNERCVNAQREQCKPCNANKNTTCNQFEDGVCPVANEGCLQNRNIKRQESCERYSRKNIQRKNRRYSRKNIQRKNRRYNRNTTCCGANRNSQYYVDENQDGVCDNRSSRRR